MTDKLHKSEADNIYRVGFNCSIQVLCCSCLPAEAVSLELPWAVLFAPSSCHQTKQFFFSYPKLLKIALSASTYDMVLQQKKSSEQQGTGGKNCSCDKKITIISKFTISAACIQLLLESGSAEECGGRKGMSHPLTSLNTATVVVLDDS